MTNRPTGQRIAAIRSIRTWSPADEVAEALALAARTAPRLYVERRGHRYRWSFAHPGGAYPLIRVTARFLGVDHRRLLLGFRTLPDGTAVIGDDPWAVDRPDAWAVVDLGGPVSPAVASVRLADALGTGVPAG